MGKLNKKINGLFNQTSQTQFLVSKVGNHSVHTVDLNNPLSMKLLARAYKDIYEPAFPIAGERESIESWVMNYANPIKNSEIVIILAGEALDTRRAVLKGMSVGYYYPSGDAGLMAYVAIAPEYRNEGLGRVMVEARKQALLATAKKYGKQLGGVFLECNDPAKVAPEQDSFDPTARIKIFEKWGAAVIPVDYTQPALAVGDEKADFLKLLAYPHPQTGEYPTPSEIEGFLYGIYKACSRYSGIAPEDDAAFNAMKAQLTLLPQGAPFREPPAKPDAKKTPRSPANDR